MERIYFFVHTRPFYNFHEIFSKFRSNFDKFFLYISLILPSKIRPYVTDNFLKIIQNLLKFSLKFKNPKMFGFLQFLMVNIKMHRHPSTWQNATQSARQKLLCICRKINLVHIKKEFFGNYVSVYNNCGTRKIYISYAAPKITSSYSWWQISVWQTFDDTDTLLIKFLRHAAVCNILWHTETMPKPHCINVYTNFGICCAKPHSVASSIQHSVDTPIKTFMPWGNHWKFGPIYFYYTSISSLSLGTPFSMFFWYQWLYL